MKFSIYFGLLFTLLWISLTKVQASNHQNDLEQRNSNTKEDCNDTTTMTTSSSQLSKPKTITGLPTATVTLGHEDFKNGCCTNEKKGECCDKDEPLFQPQVIGAGVLLIIFAVYLLVGGFMFFRMTMIVTGLLLGSTIAWICLQANEPVESYPNTSTLYIGICVGIGVFIALLFIVFYRVAMFILCGMSGVLLSMLICAWKEDFLIPSLSRRSILTFALWLLANLGLIFFEFATVIASMALLGSSTLLLGIDLFVGTGFTSALETLLDFNVERNRASRYHINSFQKRGIPPYYRPDWKSQSMMGAVLVICVLSMVWHVWFNKGKRFGVRIIRNSNDTLQKIK